MFSCSDAKEVLFGFCAKFLFKMGFCDGTGWVWFGRNEAVTKIPAKTPIVKARLYEYVRIFLSSWYGQHVFRENYSCKILWLFFLSHSSLYFLNDICLPLRTSALVAAKAGKQHWRNWKGSQHWKVIARNTVRVGWQRIVRWNVTSATQMTGAESYFNGVWE